MDSNNSQGDYQRDEHRAHLLNYHFVGTPNSPAEVVKEYKGIASFYLRKKHAHLKKLPSMWMRRYFVATAVNLSSQAMQQTIQAQKGK